MTDSDGKPHPGNAAPEGPKYADQVFRSSGALISGVLLLVVAAWLIVDAIVSSSGKTPWIALAAAPAFALPVSAYTLRPAVLAGVDRLVIRNPLRTIVVPWAQLEEMKAGYSVEATAAGKTYQVWAIPVSLRQRKRATRSASVQRAAGDPASSRLSRGAVPGAPDPSRAWSDQVVDVLLELRERNAMRPQAKAEVSVAWCWWVIVPTLLGLAALITLIAA